MEYIYIWDKPGTANTEVGSIKESTDEIALERIRQVVNTKAGRLIEVHVSARKLNLA